MLDDEGSAGIDDNMGVMGQPDRLRHCKSILRQREWRGWSRVELEEGQLTSRSWNRICSRGRYRCSHGTRRSGDSGANALAVGSDLLRVRRIYAICCRQRAHESLVVIGDLLAAVSGQGFAARMDLLD